MAYPPQVFSLLGEAPLPGESRVLSRLAEKGSQCVLRVLDKDLGSQYINCEFRQDQSL